MVVVAAAVVVVVDPLLVAAAGLIVVCGGEDRLADFRDDEVTNDEDVLRSTSPEMFLSGE